MRFFSAAASNICQSCPKQHEVIGCDPCQYLHREGDLKFTCLPDIFAFYCIVPPQYAISIGDTHKLYKMYQGVLHPDRFATSKDEMLKDRASLLSSYASTSLHTLSDPVTRACALFMLETNGEDALPEKMEDE